MTDRGLGSLFGTWEVAGKYRGDDYWFSCEVLTLMRTSGNWTTLKLGLNFIEALLGKY